jgi:hypothetical protein
LFPENEFSIPVSRNLMKETASLDETEKARAARYLNRPPEELYHVIKDPYCQENLIDKPALQETKNRLADALSNWMDEQGDTGRDVELDAHGRQANWYKRN